jgi:type IV pilus assembly protein PilM
MSLRPPRPRLACEVTAAGVLAARATDDAAALEVYAARTLPAGALTPALTAVNVHQPAALRDAIAAALEPLARRSRDVTAILPDSAIRVVLLDFDTLPEKRADAEAVLRFRLRKALPFDVERALLSWHARPALGGMRAVAAVALPSVVEEYEAAFRDAGFAPGVVLPSTLSALGLVPEGEATMVLRVGHDAAAVTIVRGAELLLFRVLELAPGQAADPERLADEVYPSAVFVADTFGVPLTQLLVSGIDPASVRPALEQQTGVPVAPLLAAARAGAPLGGTQAAEWHLAAVAGALLD